MSAAAEAVRKLRRERLDERDILLRGDAGLAADIRVPLDKRVYAKRGRERSRTRRSKVGKYRLLCGVDGQSDAVLTGDFALEHVLSEEVPADKAGELAAW